MLVFVEISIWSNAYLRQRNTPKSQMLCIGLLGLGQILLFANNMANGNPLVRDGRVQITVLQLGLGVIMVIAELTFLLRQRLDCRAEAREAEEE